MASRAAGRLSQPGEGTNVTLLLSALNKKSMYDFYGVVIAGMGLTAGPDPYRSNQNDLPALITVRAKASRVFFLALDHFFRGDQPPMLPLPPRRHQRPLERADLAKGRLKPRPPMQWRVARFFT